MRKSVKSFSFWLPVGNVVLPGGLLLFTTLLVFSHLRHAANGADALFIQAGEFRLRVRSNEFLLEAFRAATFSANKLIILLDAPGVFGDALISLVSERSGNWYPGRLGLTAWQAVTYPFFSIPAWLYVGQGLDTLMEGARIRTFSTVISSVLMTLAITISCGLRFGISASERSESITWVIAGFALWSFLFAIPILAWIWRRTAARPVNL